MGAYRHGSDTFRVCRSSRPGNAGRLKKTVPESAAALLERVSKWGLQIAEMVFQTRSGYFSQILFCCFCHNGDFFLKCYTSLLLSLSFSLPDLLI
ncbi:DUF6783 domain-containing protein [Fusicatenibacter saccharivorans]|uniref:DUF6783 domain-containing protein n=1 Tax=Fusicatenibacter saccharivorans TaxID=1150298 RepID=UPI003A7F4934